jgi:hypothetical protein
MEIVSLIRQRSSRQTFRATRNGVSLPTSKTKDGMNGISTQAKTCEVGGSGQAVVRLWETPEHYAIMPPREILEA